MRILVTGAAGFIGSHLAELLSKLGHKVIGLDNLSDYYSKDLKKINIDQLAIKNIEVREYDLRNTELKSVIDTNFDFIFHLAAQPGISSTSTFEDYFNNNIIATKNLLDFAAECKSLRLFVNIGTSSIYGLEAAFSEEMVPKPASYYGVTKLAAEQLVLQKSREKEFKSCSLRLYSVIGPRERPEKMFTKLIQCGLEDKAFPLFNGSEKHLRSFTYVGDIVDGIVAVIGKEDVVDGEIFNLGTDKEYTTQEGITAVEEAIGKKIQINVIPERPGDQWRTKAVIDKARRILNYDPKTTLKEAVEKQVKWYRETFIGSKDILRHPSR